MWKILVQENYIKDTLESTQYCSNSTGDDKNAKILKKINSLIYDRFLDYNRLRS